MSRFFDDLEGQLRAAAHAQIAAGAAAPNARRSWPRSIVGAVPVLLAVSTTIAVAVLALVLIGSRHPRTPPQTPDTPPPAASGLPTLPHVSGAQNKELIYLENAWFTTSRRDPGCAPTPPGLRDPGSKPSLSTGSPTPATLAILGVLRRPAAGGDRLPPRTIGLPPNQHTYPNGTIPPFKDVYARYIRKARHRFGANYYLVPAANVNTNQPVPERCYAEQRSALQHELVSIPARLRAGTLTLEPRYLAYLHQIATPYPGVCLLAINNTGNGGGCTSGYTISQIENGQAVSGDAPTGAEVYDGLAPDGVHTITLTFHSKYVHHSVTALVINNVFIVRNYHGRLGPIAKEIWRGTAGQTIKVIHHS